MIKVSIILPVFNVQNFLKECLDSLLNQDVKEIEIICVNDGSTDNSLNILDEYSARNKILRVISQDNQGLSVARNTGIKHALGEYILFVDSDDKIKTNIIKLLYTTSKQNNIDLLDFNTIMFSENSQALWRKSNVEYDIIKTGKEYFKEFVEKNKRQPFISAWSHLYKKELIIKNNLNFIEGKYYEDLPFTYQCYMFSSRVMAIKENAYYYRFNINSITKSKPKIKHLNDLIFIWLEMNFLVNKHKVFVPMDNFLIPILKTSFQLSKRIEFRLFEHLFTTNFFKQKHSYFIKVKSNILFKILNYNMFFSLFKLMLKQNNNKYNIN